MARRAPALQAVTIRHLGRRDPKVLDKVAPDLFDGAIDRARAAEYLRGSDQHLVVALVAGQVIGFACGVRCAHPDRPPDLLVDAVAVAKGHRRNGLGRKLLAQLLSHARSLGCVRAWAVFDADDPATGRLYAAAGGERPAPASTMVVFRLQGPERHGRGGA